MHIQATSHTIDWENVSIIEFVKQKYNRKVLESLYIEKYKNVAFNLEKSCKVPCFTAKKMQNYISC